MPTLARFGSAKVTMYADDHNPPQFHIVRPEYEVMVRLADVVVFKGESPPHFAEAALVWAARNKALLLARWLQLNATE